MPTDPTDTAAFGSMPKDGSMTIGAGVDGRPYISDPIKERIAMPGPSYNPGPEQLDAVRREIRAELDKTQAAIEREAKYAVGTEKIAAERRRQVEKEGWTPEHDAEHADGALIKAAVTYAREALWAVQHPDVEFDPTLALTIRDHQGTPASTWPTLRRRRDPPRLGLTTRPRRGTTPAPAPRPGVSGTPDHYVGDNGECRRCGVATRPPNPAPTTEEAPH
jgi:hypothetical protein